MSDHLRFKKTILILWLVTFVPFGCAGCDYSYLSTALDLVSTIAACFPPWGTVVAVVLQAAKQVGANYGQKKAQEEAEAAYAEGRAPEYDDWTRALTGMGGNDVGYEGDNSETRSYVNVAGQVVATGVSAYRQNARQQDFNRGNTAPSQGGSSAWVNPDTGQTYEPVPSN